MLTYSFNSQRPRVKNLPKGLPSGRIGSTYRKQSVIIIIIIIIIIMIIIMTIIITIIIIIIIRDAS